jgi:hypothetical protein
VLYVPTFLKNIVSLSKLLNEGNVSATWSKSALTLQNEQGATLAVKKAEDGMLYFLAKPAKGEEDGKTAKKKSMDVDEAHEKYAHMGERMLRKTMGKFGYELTGVMKACDGCMQAKAKSKAVNKVTKTESTCPGERLFLDISGPFAPSVGGSRYDVKLVDQASRKTWGGKIKRKLQVPAQVKQKVDELNAMGKDSQVLTMRQRRRATREVASDLREVRDPVGIHRTKHSADERSC